MPHSVDSLLESALGFDAPGRPFLSSWETEAAELFFSLQDAPLTGQIDAQGRLIAATDRALAAFGPNASPEASMNLAEFFHADDVADLHRAAKEARETGNERQFIGRLAHTDHIQLANFSAQNQAPGTDSQEAWVQVRFAPGSSTAIDGSLTFFVATTPMPASRQPANDGFDPALGGAAGGFLTRDAFLALLDPAEDLALLASRPGRDYLALVNIDGFHKVNDALGLKGGNAFLHICATTIRSQLRQNDPIARVGVDEFAILLKNCSEDQAGLIVSRILSQIERRAQIGDRVARCSARAGLTPLCPQTSTPDDLWRAATTALRQAKEMGGNSWRVALPLSQPIHGTSFATSLLDAEIRLHEAIGNGEFHLVYQPIFEASTRRIKGAETLMRWSSPQGMISPADFIPRAEETGLINHLGEWALRSACMQMNLWDAEGFHLGYVSVNASARQLHSPRFTQAVKQALADSKISGSRLIIEITESALALDSDAAIHAVQQLTRLGVRFSIDDFGTGHACFGNLKIFPVSTVKIDRGFVSGLPSSLVDRAIVASTLTLAKELQFDAVAEGIETEEQFAALLDMGCTSIQGYLLARPLAPDVLLDGVKSEKFLVAPIPIVAPSLAGRGTDPVDLAPPPSLRKPKMGA